MSVIRKLEKASFSHTALLALIITLVLAVGLTIFFIRQEVQKTTRPLSQQFPKPVELEKQEQPIGPIPNVPPQIGRVFPWVGKIGDVIWVQGENFGNNPREKKLIIGGVELPDSKIVSWLDTEIQAIIPEGAAQGGVVTIDNGTHQTAESLPFVLYDQTDRSKKGTQLRKNGNVITVERPGNAVKAIVWYGDETIETTTEEVNITSGEIDTKDQPILTILLYDDLGNVLPYFVDPDEFDF